MAPETAETQETSSATAEDFAGLEAQLNADAADTIEPAPKPIILNGWRIPGNRFVNLIESISFHTVSSGKLYGNQDGTSQRKVAAGLITYKGGFACTPFSVNAHKLGAAKNARVVAEISFPGNRGAQGLMPLGEKAKGELSELKAGMSRDYVTWRTAQGSYVAKSSGAAALDDVGDLFADGE